MSQIEKMPGSESNIMPGTPGNKEKEYKLGKRIVMKDGTVRTVYSLQEEIDARNEDREREYGNV